MANEQDTEVSLVDVDPQEAHSVAEKDMNFLAALCLMDKFVFMFPEKYLLIWQFLKSKVHLFRDFSQLALGIPRGFAKTTIVKLFVVYCVLFTKKTFICIVSHTQDHAINIIKDVLMMLSSPNIVAVFGNWQVNRERERQECQIFLFRGRRIIIAAMGSGGSIRGLNVGHDRPDVMIFEDFQKKEDSKSPEMSKALYEEMNGTFMKAKSPYGCLFIFVANMYPTVGSILKKLKDNPDWISFIVGGILENGTSLWEDLQPLKQLLNEYERDLRAGVPEVFLSEVLNDPTAGIRAGVDITKFPHFPFDEYEQPQGRGIVIDPALDNPNSDYNGIGLVGLFDGKPCLEKVILERFNPMQLIIEALKMGFEYQTRLITVENVNIQKTYLFWFNEVCRIHGITGFLLEPLNPGGGTKNGKIKTALIAYMKGEVLVKAQPRTHIIKETLGWDPNKQKNSDTCLDLLVMSSKLVEQHKDLMAMPYENDMLFGGKKIGVRSVEENCPI